MEIIDCLYCGKPGPPSREHVLTRAFAGGGEDWLLVDAVCRRCNTLVFSGDERAWTAAPPFADARCGLGPVGRARRGRAYVFHPAERIFLRLAGDPIAYEVDVLPRFATRYRPQLIDTGDRIISVAGNQDDIARFNDRLQRFGALSEVTISKTSSAEYRVAVLELRPMVRVGRIERRSSAADAWWDTFGADFPGVPHPRLSIDPDGRLRFRTRKLAEIATLYGRALRAGSISGEPASDPTDVGTISMDSVYPKERVHRAIAKTAVNYLADQLGVAYARHPDFAGIRRYCLGGPDQAGVRPYVEHQHRSTGIQPIDALPVNRHLLYLISNGHQILGFLKLYGSFAYRINVGRPPDGARFERATLIDYNGPGRIPLP